MAVLVLMDGWCVNVEEWRSTQFGTISGVRNKKRVGLERKKAKKGTQKIGRSTKVRRN